MDLWKFFSSLFQLIAFKKFFVLVEAVKPQMLIAVWQIVTRTFCIPAVSYHSRISFRRLIPNSIFSIWTQSKIAHPFISKNNFVFNAQMFTVSPWCLFLQISFGSLFIPKKELRGWMKKKVYYVCIEWCGKTICLMLCDKITLYLTHSGFSHLLLYS